MPFEIITIPFNTEGKIFNVDVLNNFCLNKKIITKKVEFFSNNGKFFWTVFLEYELYIKPSGKEAEGLSEAKRICYEKLREWRKERAEKDGIPPYVIARNSDLIDIVSKEEKTIEALKMIRGFGKKKIEKYGKDIVYILDAEDFLKPHIV